MNWLARLLLVIRHAYAMWCVLSLPKNRAKGSWKNIPPRELYDLAEREMEEVKAVLWAYCTARYGDQTCKHIRLETADVSAFMAMLADNCRKPL